VNPSQRAKPVPREKVRIVEDTSSWMTPQDEEPVTFLPWSAVASCTILDEGEVPRVAPPTHRTKRRA
jgi:hypothetical protein